MNHRFRYKKDCVCNVVYKIPLSCGRNYIGQTKRCVNVRLGEHKRALKNCQVQSTLVEHCVRCKCDPEFFNVVILKHVKDEYIRLCTEAWSIINDPMCISECSVAFNNCEKRFLDR